LIWILVGVAVTYV